MTLPARVDPGKVSADMKNGVLTVILPRAEEAKPRKNQREDDPRKRRCLR